MLEDAYFYSERFLSAVVTSTPVQVMILLLQILGILLSFALLGGIIYLLGKTDYIGDKRKDFKRMFDPEPGSTGGTLSRAWHDIRARLTPGYENYRQLILDATALMEHYLQDAGYVGETLAEQLAHTTPAEMRNLGDVLAAWRKARTLQEDEDVRASFEEAEMVLGAYEAALKELGFISK